MNKARPASLVPSRNYATNLPNLPPEFTSSSFFSKLQTSPKTLKAIQDITALFQTKGIATDKKPSFMEMMKLAQDPELQQALKAMKAAMDEEGVSVDIQSILKNMPASMK